MKFVAFERAMQGTGASRRLRITGRTPGIVYGGDAEPQQIEIDHNALWHALKKEAFHATVLNMELNGAENKVLLRDVQMHPFKQLVLHVDFQRVDAKTRLHMKVPLHYSGDENSAAIKTEGCIANHVITEIEVLCLPKDLPEFIAVDLSGLKKGSSLHLADVTLPKGVSAVTHGNKNPVLVSVVVIAAAAPVAAADDAAVPAAGGKAPAGKAPAAKAPAAKAPAAKKK
ncbi:MAG: 50S ribosomal protein L25/general stress protein Ctc [Gammaproteobacteria bacterium]|uniref:50S ribosomal protein L25/general stress protein Ctc n=1 Tax=Rhodoferax sp. TaxID=50421 RepID=UPI001813B8EA|nr:50S ribosomal protein L25/general stress protein Ctc [Rhodoferax sp.]MBU3898616.1 50S ribosomal protein L25/general stress protein Ctc [Gammaproteobacteria bacterium]MBA3057442.1 50S ribosomal protein L25/general stress protein Ctc [Rhodoferax sp.]MBU3997719.1 50S ribosomal protein L25/general stress protein Ctc [Gammaproteobacteria bacterium]MBU4019525.1 50S ribosomal protein L25/general stress protein Ctc [Gammaproteobacteria bacterium]MBU4079039.1 50S ribosomal protein L25/general stress